MLAFDLPAGVCFYGFVRTQRTVDQQYPVQRALGNTGSMKKFRRGCPVS